MLNNDEQFYWMFFYKAVLIGLFFAIRASSCLVMLNCK